VTAFVKKNTQANKPGRNLLSDTTGLCVSDQCAFMQVILRGCLVADRDTGPTQGLLMGRQPPCR
jgi:hypothetical protein